MFCMRLLGARIVSIRSHRALLGFYGMRSAEALTMTARFYKGRAGASVVNSIRGPNNKNQVLG